MIYMNFGVLIMQGLLYVPDFGENFIYSDFSCCSLCTNRCGILAASAGPRITHGHKLSHLKTKYSNLLPSLHNTTTERKKVQSFLLSVFSSSGDHAFPFDIG